MHMHVQVASRYASPAGNGIVDFYVGVNFVPSPAKKLWSCRSVCVVRGWMWHTSRGCR